MSSCKPRRKSRAWQALGLALLAGVPGLLSVWQWQRGEVRSAQLAAFDAAARRPAELLQTRALSAVPDMSRVQLHGRPAAASLLLANSLLEGLPGVRVLVPLALADGSAVLVDRGWLADAQAGTPLPPLPARLDGRWMPLPQRFTLPGALRGTQGRVDDVDPVQLARRLGRPLRGGVVVLGETTAPLQVWPARPPFDPRRHYGYALQWLLLGLCLIAGSVLLWRRT
ncbi:SURF1 family protein [Pseudogulbenkiania subflava]|uniref:SURF1-like protein n=1 Tax=Pseudogulbenkiania subflava DSM 22618 TaxID=1123014 RepID=A0A1Y6C526_9NEIS|nr:SURF1 family cytochrome oxidase biogenesis protein [Pseudogulbenkiania subflava]SMF34868.1 Cytochrome oxidase assembly protein ShyY1 [Pseudogulbenkiania subflava DSM 22618]